MTQNSNLFLVHRIASRLRNACTVVLAGTFALAQVTPALATIDNTAKAVGTYNSTTTTFNPGATVNVPVAPAAPALTVSKSVAAAPAVNPTVNLGTDTGIADVGDQITYQVVVTNSGNVTLNNVVPVDQGITFNGVAGSGSWSSWTPTTGTSPVTLAPTQSRTYTAVYTMTALDVYNGAGKTGLTINKAGASGTTPSAAAYTVPPAGYSTANTTVPAGPKLCINKTAVIKDPTDTTTKATATLNDIVTYTYAVQNCGNVPMTNVQVSDSHGTPPSTVPLGGASPPTTAGITAETLTTAGPLGAGASSDTVANNGIWNTLAPGATVTFTWKHAVTQAEVDNG